MSKKAAAVYVDPNTLTPWSRNPRNNEEAIDRIATSIERFGFASPIVARTEDGRIIAGHTRHAAALRLGLKDVPVRFLDIDEQKASALALADNRLGEIATWQDDQLAQILQELDSEGVDIHELGFDMDEFEAMAEESGAEPVEPEVVFSEYLDEANNYVVLLFKNEIDWLSAQTHFELESKYSKRSNGKPWSKGVGRVIDGAEYLDNLKSP